MEELEALKSTDCPECPGPPPKFRLPPPPRPSFLTEGSFCSEAPLTELEDCVAVSIIDASYRTNASLQSTALIITCSVILLLMATIVSVAFWKHKRKVQSFLPCKGASGMGSATPESRPGRPATENPLQAQGTVIMYEDHTDSLSYSQLHNHRYVNHPAQSTIEVRATKQRQQTQLQRQQIASSSSAQNFDYLDYRDPRSILKISTEPSRAVLGGYRTARTLASRRQAPVPVHRQLDRSQSYIDADGYCCINFVDGESGTRQVYAYSRPRAQPEAEQLCPLCAIKNIQHLLNKPEYVSLNFHDT